MLLMTMIRNEDGNAVEIEENLTRIHQA